MLRHAARKVTRNQAWHRIVIVNEPEEFRDLLVDLPNRPWQATMGRSMEAST